MTKARILIVEDEAIIATEIERQLKSLGYEVTSIVDTGEKAIEKAETDKPDLILSDIRIRGDKDGIETAYRIKSRLDIPVIFLTAFADEEKLNRAKIAMPFGYLLKPIQNRELKITIEMALYCAQINKEKNLAQQAMKKAQQDLEQKVLDRTQELKHQIGERKQAEQKIKAKLKEREILLQEIHHRVKNNLQVISSLIGMQILRTEDKTFADILIEFQNRIRSISFVHELICKTDNLDEIELSRYVESLVSNLVRSTEHDQNPISLFFNLEETKINLDRLCSQIPVGGKKVKY